MPAKAILAQWLAKLLFPYNAVLTVSAFSNNGAKSTATLEPNMIATTGCLASIQGIPDKAEMLPGHFLLIEAISLLLNALYTGLMLLAHAGLPSLTPLKAAMTGIELVVDRAQLWEQSAAKHVSIAGKHPLKQCYL